MSYKQTNKQNIITSKIAATKPIALDRLSDMLIFARFEMVFGDDKT